MAEQLEDFISKNRGEFEEEHLENGWSKLELKLNKNEKNNGYWLWKAAAIVLFAFSIGLMVDRIFNTNESFVDNYSEIDQVENYYTSLINQQIEEISQYGEKEFTRQFLKEIDKLDSSYQVLKMTYRQTASAEVVSSAMINNLQLRINLLTQQLEILQHLNKNQNEKIEI